VKALADTGIRKSILARRASISQMQLHFSMLQMISKSILIFFPAERSSSAYT